MLSNEELEQCLRSNPEINHVEVTGDGYHYQLLIISDSFVKKLPVSRQQWVYKILKEYITSGSLHAITMQTFTTEEWEKKNG